MATTHQTRDSSVLVKPAVIYPYNLTANNTVYILHCSNVPLCNATG